MDKIYAMKLFVRVAERESFSRAAEDIGLPKGSVSRQIQALEHQLGIRLLHRTTRRVQLTQDGMVYYERAKDLLSNLDELEGLFQPDPARSRKQPYHAAPAHFFASVSRHCAGTL